MKDELRNLLEVAMNAEGYETREALEDIIHNILTQLAWTINCPSDWRSIKEELIEEYQNDGDALDILDR